MPITTLAALALAAAMVMAPVAHSQIVAFGASNISGWNLPASDAVSAQLRGLLTGKGYRVRVVNAGVFGNTTKDMLARMDTDIPDGTTIVILDVSGGLYNDAQNGITRETGEADMHSSAAGHGESFRAPGGPLKAWTAQLRGNPLRNAGPRQRQPRAPCRHGRWSGRQLHAADERARPGSDPDHNRQPVILQRSQWADWLNPANDMAPSFKGSPAGEIVVERFVEAAQPTLLSVPQLGSSRCGRSFCPALLAMRLPRRGASETAPRPRAEASHPALTWNSPHAANRRQGRQRVPDPLGLAVEPLP